MHFDFYTNFIPAKVSGFFPLTIGTLNVRFAIS